MRRRWLDATLRRIILPEPVILTRFAIALCVFSFCFITLLSVFLCSRGKVRCSTWSDTWSISFSRCCKSVCLSAKLSAHERGSVSGDCTCIYHNCSFEGAEKPMSGANPACQVSIAHPRRFCNSNFGLFRQLNQHSRLRLSRKQVHNREERAFDSIDIS